MNCSVANCGLCKNKNRPNLSFHRLPTNAKRKRDWLHAIGQENIRPGTKDIYVCSLHFEESSFNKTLNVLRLKNDAIPTLFIKTTQPRSSNKAKKKVFSADQSLILADQVLSYFAD